MKKLILGALCLTLCLGAFTGCGNKSNQPAGDTQSGSGTNNTDEISLDELGIAYKIPEAWDKYKETNLYPLTLKGENTFAEIIYGYVSTENLERLNSDPTLPVADVLAQVCEILIAKTETFENGTQDELISAFENSEKVGEQGEYSYYFLWGAKDADTIVSGADLEGYNELLASATELKDSISTRDFDDTLLQKQEANLQRTITFSTTSLEGAPVDSTIFAPYDMTMVHFNGTYTYPDHDEFATLQTVYETAHRLSKKVNIIEAVIDAPGEEAEKDAASAKKKAEANDILTIVMDNTLGTWVKNNLTAVPSTIFVDSEGKIIGDAFVGTKKPEVYLSEIETRLNMLDQGIYEMPADETESTESTEEEKAAE